MMNHHEPIHVRTYGESGPCVILLHGGPGAAGYMAPVARRLADAFKVVEPFQRGSGDKPLTVADHVADLREVVESCGDAARPALIGHSWGAMLALAYAAEYPGSVRSLALIGCGTFDVAARERMRTIRQARMTDDLRAREARLLTEHRDPDQRLRALGRFFTRIDSVDLVPSDDEMVRGDARAHEETWGDMIRLQDAGVYPAAFAAIRVPVIMLHGADDPHPGGMIRDSLKPFMPQLEYREFARCGHYPWLERQAREKFFEALREWLSQAAAR